MSIFLLICLTGAYLTASLALTAHVLWTLRHEDLSTKSTIGAFLLGLLWPVLLVDYLLSRIKNDV